MTKFTRTRVPNLTIGECEGIPGFAALRSTDRGSGNWPKHGVPWEKVGRLLYDYWKAMTQGEPLHTPDMQRAIELLDRFFRRPYAHERKRDWQLVERVLEFLSDSPSR